jgi:hypothetical protein
MRSLADKVARSLSILGHPVVVMPVASALLVLDRRASSPLLIVTALCLTSAVVLAFSFWQVHRGRWQHVDASSAHERRSLNLFLAIVLFLAAAIAFVGAAERGLTLGLALSGFLIGLIMLVSRWVKLSLHAAFAAFAVVLLWPLGLGYVAIAALVAAAICWSRVLLCRHTVIEVVSGSVLGVLVGVGFWLAIGSHG